MRQSIHSRESEVLRQMLKELRDDAQLTQNQFAERLDRPRNYISRYEVGEKMLDLPELRQLLLALNKPFVEFMQEYDEALSREGL